MDKFALAQKINISATFNQHEELCLRGHEFYEYLNDNVKEIKNNGRHSFHIGSAFYFYRTVQKNKEDFEHRFSNLVAYINLYEALAFGDMQSITAAYRLHILLIEEKNFFEAKLLKFTGKSVGEILDTDPNEIEKLLKKFLFTLQYYLFRYCQDSASPCAWQCLSENERQTFECIYKQFQQRYKISDFTNDTYSNLGKKISDILYEELSENDLSKIEFLGTF